mmetsp:Transcript_87229/g.241936  ORF Transcript_87229/g.241936 Transcript_87229/m.241936 type:complete len:308 (+) Transcript_87229:337-1260(+)
MEGPARQNPRVTSAAPGMSVDVDVGSSSHRCGVAVRPPGPSHVPSRGLHLSCALSSLACCSKTPVFLSAAALAASSSVTWSSRLQLRASAEAPATSSTSARAASSQLRPSACAHAVLACSKRSGKSAAWRLASASSRKTASCAASAECSSPMRLQPWRSAAARACSTSPSSPRRPRPCRSAAASAASSSAACRVSSEVLCSPAAACASNASAPSDGEASEAGDGKVALAPPPREEASGEEKVQTFRRASAGSGARNPAGRTKCVDILPLPLISTTPRSTMHTPLPKLILSGNALKVLSEMWMHPGAP